VIVQYGGQTPLKLARDLEANGVPIIGTSPDMIDAPKTASASRRCCTTRPQAAAQPHRAHRERAIRWPQEIGYPLVVRPSYVLGGRAMEIVHEEPTSSATCARRSRCRTSRRCCSTAS
jgi:carbamoyl-phosphate synthase large subunit